MAYLEFPELFPAVSMALGKVFDFDEGDLLIIGGAEDDWRALEGALAIAMSLRE